LSEAELERRLLDADAAVVMKLGRHLEKVRRVLGRTGRLSRAIYVERGTTAESLTVPLEQKRDDVAPYFSVVLVPGWDKQP
jgi:precorrin-2/cobalt-factor-2 C20-methyltransferase